MYKILRIICCVISAALLAACVFIFVYLGVVWGITTVVAAGAFFALTMLFKGLQEDKEKKQAESTATDEQPEQPSADKELTDKTEQPFDQDEK